MLGGILSIISAACFGLNNATVRRGVVTGSVLQGLIISVPTGVPLFLLGAALLGSLDAVLGFSPWAYVLLSVAGIVHFVAGRYCNYRALKAWGANLTGPVQQGSLLVSLVGAIWLLDEFLTAIQIVGIALIFFGPAVMLHGHKRDASAPKSPSGFQPKYVEGFLFSALSTMGYGSSALFIRAAFEADGGRSLGGSLAGGFISYFAATLVMVAVMANRRQINHVLSADPGAVRWFIWSGINVCFAQIFRYMALAVAPVSVVAPLMQLAVVFRWIFGWTINREHEIFDVWTLLGMIFSLVGAVAVSISAEAILGLATFPDWFVTAARWRWP